MSQHSYAISILKNQLRARVQDRKDARRLMDECDDSLRQTFEDEFKLAEMEIKYLILSIRKLQL